MTDEISKFLNIRETRLSEMEIAIKLYIEIGNTLSPPTTRLKFSNDSYTDGCIYQFFAFIQTNTLLYFIFNSFISIIGGYDPKKECLKSWENFQLTQNKIDLLLEIRARYIEIRNNVISHISTTFRITENHSIETIQILKDIQELRNILNDVRKLNNIPILLKMKEPDHHAIEGMRKLFGKFNSNHLKPDYKITKSSRS